MRTHRASQARRSAQTRRGTEMQTHRKIYTGRHKHAEIHRHTGTQKVTLAQSTPAISEHLPKYLDNPRYTVGAIKHNSISGLVVEYIVAIDVTRVRFPADALSIASRVFRALRNLMQVFLVM